jgi:hypothetical protein
LYVVKDTKLTPASLAREIVDAQVKEVRGAMDAEKATKEMNESGKRAKRDAADRLETEIHAYAAKMPEYRNDPSGCIARARAEVEGRKRPV